MVADKQQRTGSLLGERIGEAIAEIQAGRMKPAAPLLVSFADSPSRCGGNGVDLKVEPFEQIGYRSNEASSCGYHIQFSNRTRRNYNI